VEPVVEPTDLNKLCGCDRHGSRPGDRRGVTLNGIELGMESIPCDFEGLPRVLNIVTNAIDGRGPAEPEGRGQALLEPDGDWAKWSCG
jgi:hypothetical protein